MSQTSPEKTESDILYRLRDLSPGYGNIIKDAVEEIERLQERMAELQYEAGMYKSLYEVSQTGKQPVAWRWRPPGASLWIYDPEPSWFDAHRHEIEHEPLYAAVSDSSTVWIVPSGPACACCKKQPSPDCGNPACAFRPSDASTVGNSPVGWGGHLPGKIEP